MTDTPAQPPTQSPKKRKMPLDYAMRQMHEAMEMIFDYDHDPNFVPSADQLVLFDLLQKQITWHAAMSILIVKTMRQRVNEAFPTASPPHKEEGAVRHPLVMLGLGLRIRFNGLEMAGSGPGHDERGQGEMAGSGPGRGPAMQRGREVSEVVRPSPKRKRARRDGRVWARSGPGHLSLPSFVWPGPDPAISPCPLSSWPGPDRAQTRPSLLALFRHGRAQTRPYERGQGEMAGSGPGRGPAMTKEGKERWPGLGPAKRKRARRDGRVPTGPRPGHLSLPSFVWPIRPSLLALFRHGRAPTGPARPSLLALFAVAGPRPGILGR